MRARRHSPLLLCLLGLATLAATAAAGGDARAQSCTTDPGAQAGDCDFDSSQIDLFVKARFESFDGCGGTTGVACTQDPGELGLQCWGVELFSGPNATGTLLATGTTGSEGQTVWDGGSGGTNFCVGYATYSVRLTLPTPSPYDAEASWPSALTFNFTVNETSGGQPVERFFLSLLLSCGCDDQDACTGDTCANGLCTFAQVTHPERAELCNAQDDDCDGDTDEGLPAFPDCFDRSVIGCSDGTREGYLDWPDYRLIASCAGAWTVPGTDGDPTCGRVAGNHATPNSGVGCSASDLCSVGWHVCRGPDDVALRTGGDMCTDAVDPNYPNYGTGDLALGIDIPPGGAFFASNASSDLLGCEDTVNAAPFGGEVFGCGNLGEDAFSFECGGLDRSSAALCGYLRDQKLLPADNPATDYGYETAAAWAWSCGEVAGEELANLVKALPDQQGGVLCCKDGDSTLDEICDGLD
ncbi:MAG: hypothetical protein KC635_06530, partial [Myxococcales bacterium]|nr:hypothetical protein [Myxococcales bacterium]